VVDGKNPKSKQREESKCELQSDCFFPPNVIVLGVEEEDNEVKLYCHPLAVAYLTVTSPAATVTMEQSANALSAVECQQWETLKPVSQVNE
jgi:hypothetical protein